MNDKARCNKKDCPSFDNCWRAQAPRNEFTWFNEYDNGHKVKCSDYIQYNEPKLDFLK